MYTYTTKQVESILGDSALVQKIEHAISEQDAAGWEYVDSQVSLDCTNREQIHIVHTFTFKRFEA